MKGEEEQKPVILCPDHPLDILEDIAEEYGGEPLGFTFEFGVYRPVPLSLRDEDRSFLVPMGTRMRHTISSAISGLAEGEELCLHSRVSIDGRVGTDGGVHCHIPLIDFSGELTPCKTELIRQTLPEGVTNNLVIYHSGRSFHGYVRKLISQEEWYRFMGSLLLLNWPGKEPVVGDRWVGYRLKRGYASLRWSSNTPEKPMYPKKIGGLTELEAWWERQERERR